MSYKTSKYGNIIKEDLGIVTLVPMDESTVEYQQYLQFLQSGGTVESSELFTLEEEIEYKTDIETQTYLKRISDGTSAISRFSAELRVAKLSGVITEEGHKEIDKALKPIRDEVLAGQWISAKDELILLGSEIIGQTLYDRIYNEIQTYINNNY
jgi:hypothetical protein